LKSKLNLIFFFASQVIEYISLIKVFGERAALRISLIKVFANKIYIMLTFGVKMLGQGILCFLACMKILSFRYANVLV
jgi:hypothetical protein